MQPRLRGRAYLIRYADDFVIVFTRRGRRPAGDGGAAEAIRQVRPDAPPRQDAAGSLSRRAAVGEPAEVGQADRPGTFDLLGFTHYWGRSRRGYWVVKQQDGVQAIQPSGAEHRPVVPEPTGTVRCGSSTRS